MPEGDIYIGLMSGTSMDAIDTALVQFEGLKPDVIAYRQFPIDTEIRKAVRKLDGSSSLTEVSKYDILMGHIFAESVLKILDVAMIPADWVSGIGSHGQTVLHLPDDAYPRTLQIGDPNVIAQKTGITTITDFRRMDMASGGQGAPLAPAFHNQVFRRSGVNRVVLNLGGIANITVLPADIKADILGFDTGPGNGLLDDWNQKYQGSEMDRDGEWAAGGKVNRALLKSFLADPYFRLARPKSTGRDYFNMRWINTHLGKQPKAISPRNVQATLLALTVSNITLAIKARAPETKEIVVCGGGAHNIFMMKKLHDLLPGVKIYDTSRLGVDPDAIEAITFAWLAHQTLKGLPGNNCAVTGAEKPEILGGIYQYFYN